MRIYISGSPITDVEDENFPHAEIYRLIAEKLRNVGYEVELPLRRAELDKLDAREFFAVMSKRIDEAERVLTIFNEGDQSTPVEATIAAAKGKPQVILEVNPAPPTTG